MYKRIIGLMLSVLLSVSLVAPGLTSAQTSSFSDLSGFSGSSSFSDSSNPSESRTKSMELPLSNELSSGWNGIVQNINPVVDATNLTNGNTTSSFIDVKPGYWFFDAANYVYQNGLFQGTGEHTFSPQGTMTRAMFVTVLGRVAGVDSSKYTSASSFTDVSSGSYYAPFVEWANKNGIVTGVGNRKFAPSNTVTREQMATIMVRYFEEFNINYKTGNTVITEPSDIGNVSSWAKDAILALLNI
ncbi:S-layer homology domain-containing protein [Paenibacillus luteus]|uniref:S-layer homology domain-containing protein n=1 Tax=Paenibacillus luteus TaxID=2545753 RepID=UPI0011428BFC|nr:S-layer homology domain-containing protein [Paenibacillus luteus]